MPLLPYSPTASSTSSLSGEFTTDGTSLDTLVGSLSILTAAIFFGSNFLPVKQYDAGDGFFFQYIMKKGYL